MCKQNRSFSSLQLNQPHIVGYEPCARDSLSRWSGLERTLRLWPSAQLLEEGAASADSKNVLGNIIFMEISAECPLAQWKTHHNVPGFMEQLPELEPLPLWGYVQRVHIGTAFVLDYLGPQWGVTLPWML